MRNRVRFSSSRCASVQEDWCAWLPEDKQNVFQMHVRHLESSYTMLSIVLNEALELRHSGEYLKLSQAVSVTRSLCPMLANPLANLIRCVGEHAKYYGTVPNAAPLNPSDFRGSRSQRAVRRSGLLHHVLLSRRTQFLHKLATLEEMVEDLSTEFLEAAEPLMEATSVGYSELWIMIDACHYDLNSCLREAIVLFKSFLMALPADQLDLFTARALGVNRARQEPSPRRLVGVRDRRAVAIPGQ